MDQTGKTERECILDLESGRTNCTEEYSKVTTSGTEQSRRSPGIGRSNFVMLDGPMRGVDGQNLSNNATYNSDVYEEDPELSAMRKLIEDKASLREKRLDGEKPRKLGCKKPPKPPRPPKAPSLDAADMKLVERISEIAMLKRARIERMKALKKMKANKASSSSSGSLCAMIITILFCLVIILQGVFSHSNSSMKFQGSPIPAMARRPGFISIQFNVNNSVDSSSASASPSFIEQTSGASMDDKS
ncbi:hypothetical protein EJ110_NYTH10518 [Nymphaea thermarum]|nr:hypothetical protein EJ110_NYTH10518 [Nymphaea thermarum]